MASASAPLSPLSTPLTTGLAALVLFLQLASCDFSFCCVTFFVRCLLSSSLLFSPLLFSSPFRTWPNGEKRKEGEQSRNLELGRGTAESRHLGKGQIAPLGFNSFGPLRAICGLGLVNYPFRVVFACPCCSTMDWFSGSINEAIARAKARGALFVVAVHGKNRTAGKDLLEAVFFVLRPARVTVALLRRRFSRPQGL